MAFNSSMRSTRRKLKADINVVPYIDVMLVLLVIFIITAPLLTNAVKIDLPQASSSANLTKPDNIQLAIDGDGKLYWNGELLDQSAINQRLRETGQRNPVPELHVHADKATRYELLAEVMSEASKDGVTRIGFVTDPRTTQ